MVSVLLQSAIQDVDYENEVELLYVVVTVPGGDEGTRALLCFIDDKTGVITKKIPIPTWHPVSVHYIMYWEYLALDLKLNPPERAPQEEQSGPVFSFVAPSSEELWVYKVPPQSKCMRRVKVVIHTFVCAKLSTLFLHNRVAELY